VDPELFERVQEAALRFRSGQSDYEEIMTPNGIARLVRDPTNALGFRIDFVGDGARHSVAIQSYPATVTRPPGYPAPLPFLANSASTVDTLDQTVTWLDPAPDPVTAFLEVARACLDDDWKERAGPPPAQGVRIFEKDGAERTLRLTADPRESALVLRERRLAPARPAP
jgi:hypothetical protein